MSKMDLVLLPQAISMLVLIVAVIAACITASFAPVAYALLFWTGMCFASMIAMLLTWP